MTNILKLLGNLRYNIFLYLIGKENRKMWYHLQRTYLHNSNPYSFGAMGKHCKLGYELTTIAPYNIYMEDYSIIQDHVQFISYKGKLRLKKYAVIAAGCIIVPGDHVPTVGIPFYIIAKTHINDVDGEIVVGEESWVGAGTILLSHCSIGRGAVVAAGSVVTKPVPPYAVVTGVPAKIIASKFTIDQILEHESILYPQEERMSREELEKLFEEHFQGKRSIGTSYISESDKEKLMAMKKELGIEFYG